MWSVSCSKPGAVWPHNSHVLGLGLITALPLMLTVRILNILSWSLPLLCCGLAFDVDSCGSGCDVEGCGSGATCCGHLAAFGCLAALLVWLLVLPIFSSGSSESELVSCSVDGGVGSGVAVAAGITVCWLLLRVGYL